MSFSVGLIYGFMGGICLCILGFVIFFVFDFMNKQKYNRLIRIKNWSAGKPYVEYYWAQLMKHSKLGMVYHIAVLKKENRQYIQYFGNEFEYSTNRSNKFYVPVSYYNGTYSPEKYDPYEIEEREVIEWNEELKQYQKTTKKITTFIIKPVKASIRQFNLAQDTQIKEEYGQKSSWWDKWGTTLLGFGALLLFIGGGIIVFILLLQYGIDIANQSSQAPQWLQQFLTNSTAGITP